MLRRLIPILISLTLTAAARGQAPLTNIVVKLDPPAGGKQVVTVTTTPTATFTADLLEIECRYRQEFHWPPGNTNVTRVIEPGIFVHRARRVRFVDSLDSHVSFFVPVDVRDLREKHGRTTFVTNAPVTISAVTVSAISGGLTLWSFKAKPVLVLRDGVLR